MRDLGEWKLCCTQDFAVRLMSVVVCPGEPFLKKLPKDYTLFENGDVLDFQKSFFSKTKAPAGEALRSNDKNYTD